MIRHALKLVWNRKKRNALVLLEIVASFLVLFAVVAASQSAKEGFDTPLGYDWQNVWIVHVRADRSPGEAEPPGAGTLPEAFLRELDAIDAVESAAVGLFPVYTGSGITTAWESEGGHQFMEVFHASPDMEEVLGLEIASGRFLQDQDREDTFTTIVINRKMADLLFPVGSDPVGQVIRTNEEDPSQGYRVVGLVEHFRKAGELATESGIGLAPVWPDEPLRHGMASLFLRMQPGTTAATEKAILDRLEAVAPTWSFDIDWLEESRESHLRERLAPVVIGGLVVTFLLVMVGLGLTGVLWQNVTRRTREIGLRRAVGATGSEVRWQVLLELQVLTVLGIAIGSGIAAQLPLVAAHVLPGVDAGLMARSLGTSALLLLLLTTACGLYPSWLATRIRPAEALHYE